MRLLHARGHPSPALWKLILQRLRVLAIEEPATLVSIKTKNIYSLNLTKNTNIEAEQNFTGFWKKTILKILQLSVNQLSELKRTKCWNTNIKCKFEFRSNLLMQCTVKLRSHGRRNGKLGTQQKPFGSETIESCWRERGSWCWLGD